MEVISSGSVPGLGLRLEVDQGFQHHLIIEGVVLMVSQLFIPSRNGHGL